MTGGSWSTDRYYSGFDCSYNRISNPALLRSLIGRFGVDSVLPQEEIDTISDIPSCATHTWGEWVRVLQPTLTADGRDERTCTVCGYEESRTVEKLQAQTPPLDTTPPSSTVPPASTDSSGTPAQSASDATAPAKISVAKLAAGKGQVKITWKKAPAAQKIAGYEIRYKEKNAKKWKVKTAKAKATSLTIKKLKKGKTYQIQIRSYKVAGGK
ncbi:MAG: fibronectin type III domain-containing protein [Clostridiales Family XIII bacterium]|nr:fibronectin type III domain-containing protein [Clostridiales Family XIII bacterium]